MKTLNALFYLTALSFVFTWLPFIRGLFDGESYQWGTTYFGQSFGGKGIGGDYYLLIIKVMLGLSLFYAGYKSPKRWLFYLLLGFWFVPLLTSNIYDMATSPEDFEFHGDTLGVHLSIIYPFAVYALCVIVLIYLVLRQDIKTPLHNSLPINRKWLIGLAAFLPVQFALLRFGDMTSIYDVVGVLITIGQCLLIPKIFQ